MTCGECAYFVTDVAEGEVLAEWKHCEDDMAFCPLKELFTTVHKNDKACSDFTPYKLTTER